MSSSYLYLQQPINHNAMPHTWHRHSAIFKGRISSWFNETYLIQSSIVAS